MAPAARRRSFTLLLTLLALAGGWYLASPWWTLWRVKAAAQDADPKDLSAYVDFEMLTQKAQSEHLHFWKDLLEFHSRSRHPDAKFYAAEAAKKLARRGVDVSIDPTDVRPWLASIPLDPAVVTGFSKPTDYRPYIVRQRLQSFEVRDWNASMENGPVLTFTRRGLGWRLEGVRYGQQ